MAPSKNFLAALGLITFNFQNFEKEIEFLAWALIGSDQEIGQIVTSQMSFRKLCDTLGSLIRYRTSDAELISELDGLLDKAAKIEQERNTIVHSAWFWSMAHDPKGAITRLKITAKGDKGLKHQYQSVQVSDLSSIASSIKSVASEVMAFRIKAKDRGVIDYPSSQIKSPAA